MGQGSEDVVRESDTPLLVWVERLMEFKDKNCQECGQPQPQLLLFHPVFYNDTCIFQTQQETRDSMHKTWESSSQTKA